jgi:hypothetical protein
LKKLKWAARIIGPRFQICENTHDGGGIWIGQHRSNIDIAFTVKKLPTGGQTIHALGQNFNSGGKRANQAVARQQHQYPRAKVDAFLKTGRTIS